MKPDPVRAPAPREPERDNASLQPARTSVRAPMRPRAAVFQRLTGSEPGRPFRGRRGRALEPLRGSTDRPSFLNDQSRETESSERGQWGVSVSHEDLLAEMVCGNPHPPGGLPFSAQPFTTCRGTTPSEHAAALRPASGALAQFFRQQIRAHATRPLNLLLLAPLGDLAVVSRQQHLRHLKAAPRSGLRVARVLEQAILV